MAWRELRVKGENRIVNRQGRLIRRVCGRSSSRMGVAIGSALGRKQSTAVAFLGLALQTTVTAILTFSAAAGPYAGRQTFPIWEEDCAALLQCGWVGAGRQHRATTLVWCRAQNNRTSKWPSSGFEPSRATFSLTAAVWCANLFG